MATPNFSALLPDISLEQLSQLSKKLGINRTQVVIRAIDELHEREAEKVKDHYYSAWVNNDQGASTTVTDYETSIAACRKKARQTFGGGWKVHIMRHQLDESGMVIGRDEVETFTLRK